MLKWRAKRAAEWDESEEWKYLTTVHGQSVERLREKFDHLEIWRVNPFGRLEAPTGAAGRMTQPFLAHQSMSPAIVTHVVSLPPRPAAVLSLGPSEAPHANGELHVQWSANRFP